MHVILSTPTHYAADAICEAIEKFNRDRGSQIDPLRTYRETSGGKSCKQTSLQCLKTSVDAPQYSAIYELQNNNLEAREYTQGTTLDA